MHQKLAFEELSVGAKHLQFTSKMKSAFGDEVSSFPLVFDPNKEQKALIIGMFVLRPAYKVSATVSETLNDSDLHRMEDLAFNYNGIDGGWLIADRNSFDAFRVALQYGISDAIIVGTNTLSKEGIDSPARKGYLWQPYHIAESEQLKMACPDAVQLIAEQRLELQRQGIISGRTYPAQIVVSYSGECQGVSDFLTARIFSAVHPNGQPFECYIITSVIGRERILERVHSAFPDLKKSIDSMVIALPSDPCGSAAFDIGLLPKLLFEKLDLRIVNHDGGQRVLRDFCRAGVVAQVNLTLCRTQPLIDIIHKYEKLSEAGSDAHGIDGSQGPLGLDSFEDRTQLFFCSTERRANNSKSGKLSGAVPLSWKGVYCIQDGEENVAVATFDTRDTGDFYSE